MNHLIPNWLQSLSRPTNDDKPTASTRVADYYAQSGRACRTMRNEVQISLDHSSK